MTIGVILLGLVLTAVIGGGGFYIFTSEWAKEWTNAVKYVFLVVGLLMIAVVWGVGYFNCNYTAAGQRALKTQKSELGNGINREVIVYDMEGDVLERFSGKFDIEYEDERILFDDENGNRHVIYFKTGTVIVNEINS